MAIQALTLIDLVPQPALALGTYRLGADGKVHLEVQVEAARGLLEAPMQEGVSLREEEAPYDLVATVGADSGEDFLRALIQQMKISSPAYYDYEVERDDPG